MALSCLVALTREPWTLVADGGLCWQRPTGFRDEAPLLGLIIAFAAAALPGWAYTLVEALDRAGVYFLSGF